MRLKRNIQLGYPYKGCVIKKLAWPRNHQLYFDNFILSLIGYCEYYSHSVLCNNIYMIISMYIIITIFIRIFWLVTTIIYYHYKEI